MARRQRGVISTARLLACGLTRHGIDTRVRQGRLHRLHRGIYAVGHVALPPLGREFAALLACGDGATLSHLSAAGVDGIARLPPTVEVTVPLERRPQHEGIRVHRSSSLGAHETRIRHGLRVTTPKRTIIDLARTLSLDDLERVVSEAHAKRLLPDFEQHEMPPKLRRVLDGGPVDSWAFHGHRKAFEDDRRRDVKLRAVGAAPVRFTARQLVEDAEQVIAHLAQLLTTRGSLSASRG